MLEAELGGGDRDMLGLQRIDRARHAGLDVAEGAGPRAGVAEDHHRRVLLGPAFADVRAGRFLAHRGQVQRAHQLARLGIAGAGRRLDPDPVGLALALGGTAERRVHARPDSDWRRRLATPALLRLAPPAMTRLWQSDRRLSPLPRATARGARSGRWTRSGRRPGPAAMVIACSDSRVDPATIFDASPGEIFVVRNVANLVPPFETNGGRHGVSAALEFAVTQLEVAGNRGHGPRQCGGCAAALTGQFDDAPSRRRRFHRPLDEPDRRAARQGSPNAMARARTRSGCWKKRRSARALANLRTFPWVAEREKRRHAWSSSAAISRFARATVRARRGGRCLPPRLNRLALTRLAANVIIVDRAAVLVDVIAIAAGIAIILALPLMTAPSTPPSTAPATAPSTGLTPGMTAPAPRRRPRRSRRRSPRGGSGRCLP